MWSKNGKYTAISLRSQFDGAFCEILEVFESPKQRFFSLLRMGNLILLFFFEQSFLALPFNQITYFAALQLQTILD